MINRRFLTAQTSICFSISVALNHDEAVLACAKNCPVIFADLYEASFESLKPYENATEVFTAAVVDVCVTKMDASIHDDQ